MAELTEAVEGNEEKCEEDEVVKRLLERTTNKRKVESMLKDNPWEEDAKLPALEFQAEIAGTPEADFPAIEARSSSIKKKLDSIPMLDYNFCSAVAMVEEVMEDERKPTAKGEEAAIQINSRQEINLSLKDMEVEADPPKEEGLAPKSQVVRGANMFGSTGVN